MRWGWGRPFRYVVRRKVKVAYAPSIPRTSLPRCSVVGAVCVWWVAFSRPASGMDASEVSLLCLLSLHTYISRATLPVRLLKVCHNCQLSARSLPQAISCAAAYESEWPLLIICPSSARYHWEHELLKWLDEDSITKKQITVVCKGKQDLSRGVTKVVIMSYELVRRWLIAYTGFSSVCNFTPPAEDELLCI